MWRLTLLCLSIFFIVFSSAKEAQAGRQDYFIAAKDLHTQLEQSKVIDARSYANYLTGHITGAVSLTWQSLSNMAGKPGDEHWGTLADTSEFSRHLSALGLQKNDKIVVYAAPHKGWGEDGRVAWSLIAAGFTHVRVLDGGYPAWKTHNFETSIMPVTKFSDIAVAITHVDRSTTIDTKNLQAQYSDIVVVDTRTKEEFEGATLYGEKRGGHLPKAKHIPFTDLLAANGSLKSNSEIENTLKKHGITKDSNIVTYCTAGIRSAHMLLALKAAGYKKVRNYDASFYHWAAQKDMPVIKI